MLRELTIGPKDGESTVTATGTAIGLVVGKNSGEINLMIQPAYSTKIKDVGSAGLIAGQNTGIIKSAYRQYIADIIGNVYRIWNNLWGLVCGQNFGKQKKTSRLRDLYQVQKMQPV